MAVSTTAAIEAAATKRQKSVSAKQHKRSRAGCWTCRVRRKKCDEAKPGCETCIRLKLPCHYRMPWATLKEREVFKKMIKANIQQYQRDTKVKQSIRQGSFDPLDAQSSPPGSCRSKSTIEDLTDSAHEAYGRSRSGSVYPNSFGPLTYHREISNICSSVPCASDPYHYGVPQHDLFLIEDLVQDPCGDMQHAGIFGDSDASPDLSACQTMHHQEPTVDIFAVSDTDFTTKHWLETYVQKHERPLLDHFFGTVARFIFPVWDLTQNVDPGMSATMRMLQNHTSFLHCCLSVAAMHKKAANKSSSDMADAAIMDQRSLAVKQVCDALENNEHHEQILEASLAMILFPCSVGWSDDAVTDIAWHEHFLIAQGLIESLDLHNTVQMGDPVNQQDKFATMSITAWIDILGATMRGKSPVFAGTWRELNVAARDLGLSSIMGCDDTIMYLISEIACLEEKKAEGMDEVILCRYIEVLGNQISLTESATGEHPLAPTSSYSSPADVVPNITAAFRLAARIYLCSLVPGFTAESAVMVGLVAAFTKAVDLIPAGEFGFDRSLAWPLLIAGSQSTMSSNFREMLEDRFALLNDETGQGSLARVRDILYSLWAVNDFADHDSGLTMIHWRDVMMQKGMNCLLI